MITTEQALEIAQQTGFTVFYDAKNFQRALNLAAAKGVQHAAKLMSYREPQDQFKPFAIETWLLEVADEYRKAGEMK